MKLIFFVGLTMLVIAAAGRAADKPNSATTAAPRDNNWVKRHQEFVEIAKKGGVDVLFLGDSITDGWRGEGKAQWETNFVPLKAANFGISGDRTQHVLWRLENGELEGITPKLTVLMIGTNNLGNNTDEEIVDGIRAVIKGLYLKCPQTKLLLLGIFPRGEKASDPARARIKHINAGICIYDNNKTIRFLDISPKFLSPDGTLSKDIMPDGLHPNAKGYEIWASAILPMVKTMLK